MPLVAVSETELALTFWLRTIASEPEEFVPARDRVPVPSATGLLVVIFPAEVTFTF